MKHPGFIPGVSSVPKLQLRLILPAPNKQKKTPFSNAGVFIQPRAFASECFAKVFIKNTAKSVFGYTFGCNIVLKIYQIENALLPEYIQAFMERAIQIRLIKQRW